MLKSNVFHPMSTVAAKIVVRRQCALFYIYRPIHPPSTVTISPLTYALAPLLNHTTTPLKSSGEPHRPAGILLSMLSARFSSAINACARSVHMHCTCISEVKGIESERERRHTSFISVAIYPGAIALTFIPFAAHSLDSAFVSCPTPPFEAAYAGTVIPPWKVRSEATTNEVSTYSFHHTKEEGSTVYYTAPSPPGQICLLLQHMLPYIPTQLKHTSQINLQHSLPILIRELVRRMPFLNTSTV
jgi:hypothetical protein